MSEGHWIRRAIEIAAQAHDGLNSRDAVEPQVCHVLRVGAAGKTNVERCVGFLHDVCEDSVWTVDDLRAEGFPAEVVEAVGVLTRHNRMMGSETYSAYIQRVKLSPLATAVKLNDLRDNIARGAAYPSLVKRYEQAYAVLSAAALPAPERAT